MNRTVLGTARYSVEARLIFPGVSEAVCGDATLRFDTAAARTPDLFGPAELLATAFAACILKNVERFSQTLKFHYLTASVRVEAERQQSPPKMTAIHYELHIMTNEPAHRVELLHRNIRTFGTIYNTLAAACDVSGEVIADKPPLAVVSSKNGGPSVVADPCSREWIP
jgi:uncharacterized OsmC-like protein